jgi:hypothetical protein
MPFDATGFRQPRVTVLPPTPPDPPERGGGEPRQRIHLMIEIVQRQPPQRATGGGYRFGTLTLWLLIIGLLAALAGCGTAAQAQPQSWSSYKLGGTTIYNGTDSNGGQWNGSAYDLGSTTYSQFVRPDGKIVRCSSYELGSTKYTRCDP